MNSEEIKELKELEQTTKNYKLKKFCPDCEECKIYNQKYLTEEELNSLNWKYRSYGLCFKHREKNPIKLQKEEFELKLITALFLFVLVVLSLLIVSLLFYSWAGIFAFSMLLPLFVYLIYLFGKDLKDKWKNLNLAKSWWVKKREDK